MSRKFMVDLAINNKSSGGVSRKLLVAAFQKILFWVEDDVPNFWDSASEKILWMQKENHKKLCSRRVVSFLQKQKGACVGKQF